MSENNRNNESSGGQPKGGKDGKKFPNSPRFNFNFYWIYGIIIVVLIITQFFQWGTAEHKILFDDFERTMLVSKDVDRIVVTNDVAHIYIKKDKLSDPKYKDVRFKTWGNVENPGPHYYLNTGPAELFSKKVEEAQKDFKPEEKISIDYEQDSHSYWDIVLNWLLPIGFFIVIWVFIMRRMGGGGGGSQIFNIGKSKAQLFDKDLQVRVTFNDVAGLEEAKVEVMEIVDFLKTPKKYTTLGGKIPRGALLVGPPGTGKTLLAKAVAGEAQVPFFSLSGSDFVEMFVGVGASRVRDLFRQAKEKAPCIIFIDEIDAIGRARGKSPSFSANDERESTLNQLLTEMDGFGSNSGVIILAATNRADILDRALLRPGRFDRQIYVELPDVNGRKAIFLVHLKPLKINDTLDIDFLARQTPGFSGADIANVCNEAALIAARKNKTSIDKQDFLDAIDRIIGGLEKKNKIISPQEKKVIAFHEAGHAAVSWLLEHAHPLIKVTIVPRGNSLGAAWYLPEERQITTTDQLMDEICAALGGRVAEDIIFGKISTGALSDLEKITKQAYAMVTIYGLNEKIGNISFYDSSGQQEYTFNKPYSEQTAETIDSEVKKMIDIAYARTKDILSRHKEQLSQLAGRLLEREVIFKEDLEQIFGKRQWEDKPEVPLLPVPNSNGSSNGSNTPKDQEIPSMPPVNPPTAFDANPRSE
ncbi:MAG: ATP-dependent zinc metalloprotease FtsH [Bacteroidetes bacterium]|nr:ATP-dependent zinc metalloprotease FtsH [Bacteroidota bacterium]MBL0137881.1 ATP-dependent zinc metalloprotease FtsH [Bacteroidota bacterium]